MADGACREVCARFRLTSIIIILMEIAVLILFGFFVRYDNILGMPSKLKSTTTMPEWTTGSMDGVSSTTTSTTTTSSSSQSSVSVSSTVPMGTGASSPSSQMMLSTMPVNVSVSGNGSSNTPISPSVASPAPQMMPNDSMMTTDAGQADQPNEEKDLFEVNEHINSYYPMFQDIHVMMFIGFGFLMTFLKKYGFSSVGINFLVAAFVLQWATLTAGWILDWDKVNRVIQVDMVTLINADFAAAAILISFGAVLGKVSALQVMVMAFIEVVAFQANELFVFKFLKATDVGDSMVVHIFGAYFGLAVSWVLYRKEVAEASDKEGSVYHSDIFSMIGTVFLWLFWPSFNAATAVDEGRLRAVVNTYYSLTASTVCAFAISSLVTKDKFNMVHVQNSTLAGGVAVGTLADMIIQPWGAILVGSVAGTISVLGFRYLTPFLSNRLKLHDTCGVNNLHGMPGLISGIGSILAAGIATPELYGDGLAKIFPRVGPPNVLAGYQCAATFVSLFMGLVCGAITGVILRIPIWNTPTVDEIFDDDQGWQLPNNFDDDDSVVGKTGQYTPKVSNNGKSNVIEMPQQSHARTSSSDF